MTASGTPAPWRLRLSARWRQALSTGPDAVTTRGTATLLGLAGEDTHDLRPPRDISLDQVTRVIPHLAVAQRAALDDTDPPAFREVAARLGLPFREVDRG